MGFILAFPSFKPTTQFTIDQVRTKSSVAKQKIKATYRKLIITNAKGFTPADNSTYLVCVRIFCSNQRHKNSFPDAENVTKEIIDTLFPDDSINIVKGVQTEAVLVNKDTNDEKTEVYIYCLNE